MSGRFGELEKERGLIALAMANGNASQAARDLASDEEHGFTVSKETLLRWQQNEGERYAELRSQVLPKIRALAAQQHLRLAEQAATAASETLTLAKGKLSEIPARDLPGAVRNFSTASAIHVDKAQLLSDQPTAIVRRGSAEVLRELAAEGLVIDVEAEEIDSPAEIAAPLSGG
jgi:hypothetical protein